MGCATSTSTQVEEPVVIYNCNRIEAEYRLEMDLEQNWFYFKKRCRKEGPMIDTMHDVSKQSIVKLEGIIELKHNGKFCLVPKSFSIKHNGSILEDTYDGPWSKVEGKRIFTLPNPLFADSPEVSAMITSFLPMMYFDCEGDLEIVLFDGKEIIEGTIYEKHIEMEMPWLFASPMTESPMQCIPIPETLPPEFTSKVMVRLEKSKMKFTEMCRAFGVPARYHDKFYR